MFSFLEERQLLNQTDNIEGQGLDLKGKPGPQRALSVEGEFCLPLCRGKVGLLEEDLVTKFRISQGLLSKILTTWKSLFSSDSMSKKYSQTEI